MKSLGATGFSPLAIIPIKTVKIASDDRNRYVNAPLYKRLKYIFHRQKRGERHGRVVLERSANDEGFGARSCPQPHW